MEVTDAHVAAGKPGSVQHWLLGRNGEVESLTKALADLGSGTGRAIALVGDPGIGKSALVRAAVAQARAAGIPVFASSGGRINLPPALGRPEIAGARMPNGRAAAMSVVDDLHTVPDSAPDRITDIEWLMELTAAGPFLCLLAYRQRQVSPELAAVLSRASSIGLLDVWNLEPLSPEHARALLGDHPNADEVLRQADGNPQYLQLMATDDKTVDARTAILGELAGLDPTSRAVLEVAAVLGGKFHPELLAAVADLELAAATAVLDALTRVDLVRPAKPAPLLSLRHLAVGKVVYQRLDPGRRTYLHQRAEVELAARAAPIAERAFHIAQAPDARRPDHATVLIASARDTLYVSPAVATHHLDVALSLLQRGGGFWYEAKVLLARSRLLTGDAAEGQALLGALRAEMAGGPPEMATALADSSRIERLRGRYSEAGALARAGLASLAENDSATATALHVELSDHAYDLKDYATSQHHAETAAVLAREHEDSVGEANALAKAALACLVSGNQAGALAMATRAAELFDAATDEALVTNVETAQQLGLTEGMLGRLVDSERHLARGTALSRRTGQIHARANLLTTLTNAQLRTGNLRGALASSEEAGRLNGDPGSPATEAIFSALRADALFWRGDPGDLAEAGALGERAVAIANGLPTTWAVSVCCTHAEFLLNTGDPARATSLLLEAAGGDELPLLPTWRRPRSCDILARAAASVGDYAAVEHWARMAEASVTQIPSTGRMGFAGRARMRAHAGHGDTDRALRSAQEAIVDFASSGERIELGCTLLAAAALSLDADRPSPVSTWLDRVALLAEQCGSGRLAAEVATQRARLAPKSDSTRGLGTLPVLSRQERKVAELAITGMTNRDIAETLFLSVRTVESHLRTIYRKLGVSNRTSLARAVLDSGPPGATRESQRSP